LDREANTIIAGFDRVGRFNIDIGFGVSK